MSSLLVFVLVAVALVAAALGFVLPTLLKARTRGDAAARAAVSAEIYRLEVDELQQEVVHGELSPGDAQAAREDLRRRLMTDTRERSTMPAAMPRSRRVALIVAVALPLVAGLLYFTVGRPGALTDEEAPLPTVAAQGDYVEQLQKHLSRQPRDGRGWVLLARAQADRNEFKAAAAAYEKAITVSARVAKDPAVLCEYADALGMAQGGSLSGRPAELVAQAMAIDPAHPVALEMAGSVAYGEGRYADAARYWKQLLAGLTPGSERHAELTEAVARAERKAAVTLPR
ncbi:MAG: c-type cytochrome biogenesis protein CcmI [Betaproteobacteria bacterium]